MGEFEQAKPIIERIKNKFPQIKIVASFFSPSGLENQKNYRFVDSLVYLPIDTPNYVKYFLNSIQPNIAVFVRYEIWMNFLTELKNRNIPTFLINATQPRRRPFIPNRLLQTFYSHCFNLFTKIFPLHKEKHYFELIYQGNLQCVYDTRYDRVWEKINSPRRINLSKSGETFVLVAGSIWEPDVELIANSFKEINKFNNISLILVPHEPTAQHLEFCKKFFPNAIEFSKSFDLTRPNDKPFVIKSGDVILVDKVGYLLDLYSVADIAYVGGGFTAGVHSVIEPAGYFIPVMCGGDINNSPDALEMKEEGFLFNFETHSTATKILEELLHRDDTYNYLKNKCKSFFLSRIGSSDVICSEILKTIKKI